MNLETVDHAGKSRSSNAKDGPLARVRRSLDTQIAVLGVDYSQLTPRDQGYVTYWQGAWNLEVPPASPYPIGSNDHREFERGQFDAMLDAQDSES